MLLVGYLTFLVVSPFLVPLGWAAVLAVCVYPIYGQLTPRLGRSGGAVLTTILVLLLIVVPVWLIAAAIVREGGQAVPALQSALAGKPPDWLTAAWGWLQTHVPELAPTQPDGVALRGRPEDRRSAGVHVGRRPRRRRARPR